jgi:hypothetical protein
MVAASLACAIVFVAAMIGARVATFDRETIRAQAPLVVKAAPSTTFTSKEVDRTVR